MQASASQTPKAAAASAPKSKEEAKAGAEHSGKENEVVMAAAPAAPKTKAGQKRRQAAGPAAPPALPGPRRQSTRAVKRRRTVAEDSDEEADDSAESSAAADTTAEANSSWDHSTVTAAQMSLSGSEYMLGTDPYAGGDAVGDPFSLGGDLFPAMLGTPGKSAFPPMSPFRLVTSPGGVRRSARVKALSPSSGAARGLLLSPVKMAPSTPLKPAQTPSAQLGSPSTAFSPTSLFSIFNTPRGTPRRTIPAPRLDDAAPAGVGSTPLNGPPAALTPAASSMPAAAASSVAPTPEKRHIGPAHEPDVVMADSHHTVATATPGNQAIERAAPRSGPGSARTSLQLGMGAVMSRTDLAAINSRINREPVRKVLFTPTKGGNNSPPPSLTPRRTTPRRTPGEAFGTPRTRIVMDALEAAPSNAGAAELRRLETAKDDGRRQTVVAAEEVLRALSAAPPVGGWDV